MCAFESHLSDLWLGRSTGRSPPCHGGGCGIIPHPSRYTSVPKRLGTTLIKLQTRVQIPSLVLYRYSSIGIRAHHYEWWGWRFESFYRCSWPYSITASVYWIVSPKIWVRLPVGSLLIIAKIQKYIIKQKYVLFVAILWVKVLKNVKHVIIKKELNIFNIKIHKPWSLKC